MSEKRKVVVFKGVKEIDIEEFDIPKVDGEKALVKIDACAICTWEQRVYNGVKKVDFPFVGGHEIVGTIVALGDKIDKRIWKIGDKVAIGANLPCKSCYQCKSGNEQNCEYFNHTQDIEGIPYKGMGGFESHIVAHPNIMFKYDQITPEEATLTEPLSCVTHSVDTAGIKLGEMVLVIGCGTMGLLHTMLSVKKGASVIVSDMNEERLKLAQKLGAKYIINPSKEDLEQRIMEITDGKKVQVIFDTTPVAEVVEDACKVLSNNGRLVLYSSFYPDKPVTFSPDWIHKSGVKIMGTANSNTQDFVKATSMLSEGIINVKDLISEVYPVDQAKQALESAAKGDKFRVIITF